MTIGGHWVATLLLCSCARFSSRPSDFGQLCEPSDSDACSEGLTCMMTDGTLIDDSGREPVEDDYRCGAPCDEDAHCPPLTCRLQSLSGPDGPERGSGYEGYCVERDDDIPGRGVCYVGCLEASGE